MLLKGEIVIDFYFFIILKILFLKGVNMSFEPIKDTLETAYNSARPGVNLLNDFYIPVLSNAVRYDRISCYFTSCSLAAAARGISKFIENNGKMRLICGWQLDPEDVNSIKKANEYKDLVDENFLKEYKTLEEGLRKDYVRLLGWMIANEFLEIKIGFNMKDPTRPIDHLVHTKTGLLYDDKGEIIFFNGSTNETCPGWDSNLESISVLSSWNYMDGITPHIKDFDDSWNNNYPNLYVIDIPEYTKLELINDAPKTEEEYKKLLKRLRPKVIKRKKGLKEPYPYQSDAIKAWGNNGRRGIFEMATGTGKTITALNCLKGVLDNEDVLTVIACPYIHLIDQWRKDVELIDSCNILEVHSKAGMDYKKKFNNLMKKINKGVSFKKHQVILTSHDTFYRDYFLKRIQKCNKKMLLIVDEVHNAGGETIRLGLDEKYDYRLGLSATPRRYMDPEGTKFLEKYFNKVVFEFTIENALYLRDEEGKHFLTKYIYKPYKVNVSKDEEKKKSAAQNARSKYVILNDILDSLEKPVDHLVVFCSDRDQITEVENILKRKNIMPVHKFTHIENRDMRKELLEDFDKGDLKALLAIRCLNEGVDVPSTDKVIIMSSSPNPAEYVQRRGRVLRRYEGKDKAYIYDLIVIPEDDSKLTEFKETEVERLIEFINSSDNHSENIEKLKEWGLINE